MLNEEDVEQIEVVNNLLLDMVKTQRENNKNMVKVFITSIICLTIIFVMWNIWFLFIMKVNLIILLQRQLQKLLLKK